MDAMNKTDAAVLATTCRASRACHSGGANVKFSNTCATPNGNPQTIATLMRRSDDVYQATRRTTA